MDLLTEYQERLSAQVAPWGRAAVLIFRGQRDGSWKLNSSADRRLEKESNPLSLIDYLTRVLIEPARSEGYSHQHNRELNDLELLAKLQHYSAATCLIDFTANFHIALWFACADDMTDGKVFVVNRGDTQNFKEVTLERAKEGIVKLLQPQTTTQQYAPLGIQPEFYYWKPPAHENRIVAQHSCFIFSARPVDPVIYREISISKEHKKEIRMLLQKYYGIETQSIFRDFGGFAASQGQDEPITPTEPASAEQLLRSANEYFRQGKYEEALADYNEAIRIDPQDALAYYNRGTTKGALDRHQEAIHDFDQAIRLKPQEALAYDNRGTAKGTLGQLQEAIDDFDQAISLNPQHVTAYYNRGTAKGRLGRFQEAIDDFDQAIRINPKSALAYNNRGNAKSALGRQEEAIVDYSEAIRLKPHHASPYYNRGIAKGALGRYEEAIADYSEAIRLNPKNAKAYCNRGIAKGKLDRHEEAFLDFDEALSLSPQFGEAYFNRGVTNGILGRHEEAIADYSEAIHLNPLDASAYYKRGNVQALLWRHQEAIVNYDAAIRLDPKLAAAYYNRGVAYKETGQNEKARGDLQRALELATEQGDRELAQKALRLLDDLAPPGTVTS